MRSKSPTEALTDCGQFHARHELQKLLCRPAHGLRVDPMLRDHLRSFTTFAEAIEGASPEYSWTDIAGAGNVYRHSYEDVLEQILWHTLKHALQPLKAVVEEELCRRDAG